MNTERRIFSGALWLIAACLLLGILSACSPYAETSSTMEPVIPSPSATATTFEKIQKSPTPAPDTCRVTTNYPDGRVNLRSRPSRTGAVIRIASEAELFTVIGASRLWLAVIDSTTGSRGYIYSEFCK